jgi:hypothetical protein
MRNISESDLMDMFSNMVSGGLIDKKTWDRISGVFWIRGMDAICWKDNKFKEYVYREHFNNPELCGDFPFAYLYNELNVLLIASELGDSPLFQNLGFQYNTIWNLSRLFLWAITKNVYNAFGNGFGGIEMMKQTRLPEV